MMQRILVVKLGAFGDFVQAFRAFAAIRAHHAADHVTLLTTAPFVAIAQSSPWFDAVLADPRAPWWQPLQNRRTIDAISRFDFIYDLQTSRRSSRYYRQSSRPPWSGIAPGCSHPHANPARDAMHTLERQREQLEMAGIAAFPQPKLDWLTAAGSLHGLAGPFGLMAPGCGGAAEKRWPIDGYAQVARALLKAGITPVVIGTAPETPLALPILAAAPGTSDLTGRTSIADLAALGAQARIVVGNDTGPVHLAAMAGAPTVVLFSAAGVPEQASPRGPAGEWPVILRQPSLRDLDPACVIEAMGLRTLELA